MKNQQELFSNNQSFRWGLSLQAVVEIQCQIKSIQHFLWAQKLTRLKNIYYSSFLLIMMTVYTQILYHYPQKRCLSALDTSSELFVSSFS